MSSSESTTAPPASACRVIAAVAPIITANWEASSDNTWLVPLGGGGRVFKVGPQPVNGGLQAYYNVVEKPRFGPDWSLRFTVALLFPK